LEFDMRLSVQEILTACKGKLLNSNTNAVTNTQFVSSVSIDSRHIAPGALFVPLKGENTDGHHYIIQAAESGAACALTEKPQDELLADGISPSFLDSFPLVHVPSTRAALMDLAAYYRRLHNIKVIAVTGSAGKTTTKEMIASVLAQRFTTNKTICNYNNDIGLPLSVFRLKPDDEVLVLEMGMNHANEITELSKAGAPHIAVITHIGDAHIENFENREGILRAKLEIVDGLHPEGVVILNGDDPLLTSPAAQEKTRPFTVRYPSSSNIISTEPLGMDGTRCHFTVNGQDIHINVPLPGNHMVMNALLAASVGIEMGLHPREITAGFDNLEIPDGRLSVTEVKGLTLINDAYNANPASMAEAIKVLMLNTKSQRRVCILGDMNELGHAAEARHRELGAFAADAGVDLLITVGTMAQWMREGFLAKSNRTLSVLHFNDIPAFLAQWETLLFPGDAVLVKASRGMAFEKIVEAITEGLA
jgi:UDP-N-acetylmuramoyl-tripeptide--D-alanyl-D-alanine ligase